MLKGFAITPVVVGRISIGEIVEKNGKKIPKKSDHIRIQAPVQVDGNWVEHPAAADLLKAAPGGKLRSIPVRIMFDTPDNNFRAELNCFDNKGRPLCAGDGEKAKRRSPTGIVDETCPGHENCEFGQANRCKPFARLIVGLEGEWQRDPLAGFMFRTTSYNSIRALTARLAYLSALTGGKIAGMPCDLKMRSKSSAGSMRQPIFYLDLEPRGSLMEAVEAAKLCHTDWETKGMKREALEAAVSNGYAQSAFMEVEEDGAEVGEDFFLSHGADDDGVITDGTGEGASEGQPAGQPTQNTAPAPAAAAPAATLSAVPSQAPAAVPVAAEKMSAEDRAFMAKGLREHLKAGGSTEERMVKWLGYEPSTKKLEDLSDDELRRAFQTCEKTRTSKKVA